MEGPEKLAQAAADIAVRAISSHLDGPFGIQCAKIYLLFFNKIA
jgi:hypothetical protein